MQASASPELDPARFGCAPAGGLALRRVAPAQRPRRRTQASETLNFCITNGAGGWDNADGVPGRNYCVNRAGTYRLVDGQLMLLPPNLPVLLVRRSGSGAEAQRVPPPQATRPRNAAPRPRAHSGAA